MSAWDPYIDNLICQSKKNNAENIDRAIIIDKVTGDPWTQKKSLKLGPKETRAIVACYKNNNFSDFMSSGVFSEGIKYQFLRQDGKAVYAKKKDHGTITMQSTGRTIIIAHCPEGSQQGDMNKAVGVVAEYLESLGY